ncbi:hypothetical protein SAMN04488123_105159 [Natribacillus halophilus]|uniref:Uncharacterized protein n=1 Tax=Natribacillus halophilus TaxID=549003 RepID=A0A1G8N2A0_9BACI|nr:hypothetical protein [Natribacillus halophilus]SDI74187.1 hypothetical protein SAMN04488123_105159 [Natribacillus halophilus]
MANLGTSKKPIILRVPTEERAVELNDFCDRRGWKVIVGIEEDKPEDISDLQRMMGEKAENTKTIVNETKVGRNDPCPCEVEKSTRNVVGSTIDLSLQA